MGNVLQSLAPYVLLLVVLILAVGIAALVSMPQRPADEKFTLILLAELSYGLGLAVSALISSHFHAVVQGRSCPVSAGNWDLRHPELASPFRLSVLRAQP
jgi:hypothetical protein